MTVPLNPWMIVILRVVVGCLWAVFGAAAMAAHRDKDPLGALVSLGIGLQFTILLVLLWQM